jgi:hypothetical protein
MSSPGGRAKQAASDPPLTGQPEAMPAPDGLAATSLFCVASTGSVQLIQVLLAFQGLHGEGHMAAASDAVL